MHRLFAAIRPPEPVRDLLIDAMDESPALRWVGEDNLHLTLRFIGEVERPLANDIAAALNTVRAEAFELRMAGLGSFERRNGGAIWAGVAPREPVTTLASRIDRACVLAGLESERRAFHPHITLARFGRDSRREAESFVRREAAIASEPFSVDRFTLFESRLSRHGAHYEEVAEFALVQ